MLSFRLKTAPRCPGRQPSEAPFPERPRFERHRQDGIALMVVMVVFVVLYLVVFQLHFSTSMEEKMAQVRYGEVESAVSLHSAALYVITLLIADLKQDMTQSAGGGESAMPAAGEGVPRATGGKQPPPGVGDGAAGAGGSFNPISSPAGGGSGKSYDDLHENVFNANQRQVGNTTVKITVEDGERKLSLNRLFGYPRLESDDVVEGQEDVRASDVADAIPAGTADGDLVKAALKGKALPKTGSGEKNKKKESSKTAHAGVKRAEGGEGTGGAAGGNEAMDAASEALDEYEEEEWEEPTEEAIQKTTLMLERAIDAMLSINIDYGYRYAGNRKYTADPIARAIVSYVLERKRAPYQRTIYLVTELLNVEGVTPELFYGPLTDLKDGEEVPIANNFVLRRDEFGDVVPQYQTVEEQALMEEQQRQLEDLQHEYGQFKNFPGLGLGRLMQNSLTRGMTEPPLDVDPETGEEYVMEIPRAMGLKDLFTTFSTGKININTASVPVLYALLLSLSEGAGGEANKVAIDIQDYRNHFQAEKDDEGVNRVKDKAGPDLGQPKRQKREEDPRGGKAQKGAGSDLKSALAGAVGTQALDALDSGVMGSGYQDLETNYFTSLEQLVLIDGEDGGPNDLLRQDEGVKRVSAQEDTPFRRAKHDLEKVAVFGSTYFTAELKAKPKNGRSAKTGCLTVRRDPKKKLIEVILWKNFQR